MFHAQYISTSHFSRNFFEFLVTVCVVLMIFESMQLEFSSLIGVNCHAIFLH